MSIWLPMPPDRPAAERDPLRPASEWKYLGKSMPRLDIPAKVTGTATFGIDVRVEGMRFAALRRNPALGAGMRGFDPAPALAMAGVERVVDLGDGIAVVANNTWIAMQAAEAVEIDWAPSTNPATTEDAFAVIAAAFDGGQFDHAQRRRSPRSSRRARPRSPPNTACPIWPMPRWSR
jgi:hypothetical protein